MPLSWKSNLSRKPSTTCQSPTTSTPVEHTVEPSPSQELDPGIIERLPSVASSILETSDPNLRERLIKALNLSYSLDESQPSSGLASPKMIDEVIGLGIEIQKQYRIALTKETALEFLKSSGLPVKEGKRFNTALSKGNYKKEFCRRLSSTSNRPKVHLYTYTEILRLTESVYFGGGLDAGNFFLLGSPTTDAPPPDGDPTTDTPPPTES